MTEFPKGVDRRVVLGGLGALAVGGKGALAASNLPASRLDLRVSVGAAMAAAPHHDMAMMEAGHCQSPPSGTAHHDKMDGKRCCIAMCAAVAVASAVPAEMLPPRPQIADFALPKTYHGLHTEIATPPPRRS